MKRKPLLMGICCVMMLFLSGCLEELASTSSPSRAAPGSDESTVQETEEYDFSSERINREGHPTLLDPVASATECWKEDLNDNAVVIRKSDKYDQEYPNAYLLLDCFQQNDGTVQDSETITAIHIPSYNCKDIPRFTLPEAIEIARSYLPMTVLTEKYALIDTEYEELWTNDYVPDGTRKQQIQYDYYANYELKEESPDYPAWISIHLYTDRYGIVVDTDILSDYHESIGETAAWGYDYIENNSSYEVGVIANEIYVDKELAIDFPRPSGKPVLLFGSRGCEVAWLQQALNKALGSRLEVNYVFDSDTDTAVREFQSRCSLGTDGQAGPKTIAALVDILSGNKSMPEKVIATEPVRVIPEESSKDDSSSQSSFTPISDGYYILNTSTMKIHRPSCSSIHKINDGNKQEYYGTVEELEAQGYTTCGKCHPR